MKFIKQTKLIACITALMLFFVPSIFAANNYNLSDTIPPSKNAIKATILSLGSGSSRFSYERAYAPTRSAEVTLGLVGLGWNFINQPHPQGLLLKTAHKWVLAPQPHSTSWLSGLFTKLELIGARFDYQPNNQTIQNRQKTTQAALLAEIGYQLVMGGWFNFDVYAGLGPSLGSGNLDNYFHSFMLFPANGYLAYTAGFRVGVAF